MNNRRRHYSKAQKLKILQEEDFDLTTANIETLAKIFDDLTFEGLKQIAKAAMIMSKGTD